MRLILLTCLTMLAFAANSILNRMALADGAMGPAAFAMLRLISGALVLAFLALRQGPVRPHASWLGAATLALYMLGFSFAYVSLPAGPGALLLFGGVQVTMFAGALWAREVIPPVRWIGAGVALAGLVILLWPQAGQLPNPGPSALMLAAALGWGLYSLHGRGTSNPLAATASSFVLASPLAVLVFVLLPDQISAPGMTLAVLSGALTSGLGYALWYALLPQLGATRAAVSQLSVPVIAALGGVLFLAEPLSWRFALACVLVLGGVAVSLRRG